MITTRLIFFVLATAILCWGRQGDAPINIEIEVTSTPPTLILTNKNESPITAFVMIVNPDGSRSVRAPQVRSYFDVYVNRGRDLPIVKGDSRSLNVAASANVDSTMLKPEIKAVLFADGGSYGDARWIRHLLLRRKRLLRGLSLVNGVILDVVEHKADLHSAIAQLEERRNKARNAPPVASAFRADRDLRLIELQALETGYRNLVDIQNEQDGDTRELRLRSFAALLSAWLQEIAEARPPLPAEE